MKKVLLFSLFIFLSIHCFSQKWDWAKNYGNDDMDYGSSIGVDGANNIYITGVNRRPGAGTYAGFHSSLLQKYDPSGMLLWTDTLNYSDSRSVTDKSGNTYIVGNNTQIMKYDKNGNELWHQNISNARFVAISLMPSGDIVIAGYTYGSLQFGGINLSTSNAGFLARCDSNGSWLWAQLDNTLYAKNMTVSSTGNIFICGSAGNGNLHAVKKYDEYGTLINEFVNNINAEVVDITVDANENFYLTGWCMDLQPLILQGDTIVGNFGYHIMSSFFIKYDYSGNVKFYKFFKGAVQSASLVAGKNNIYLSGNILNKLEVDGFNFDIGGDVFTCKMDFTGVIEWIKTSRKGICPTGVLPQAAIADMILDSEENPIVVGQMSYAKKFDDYEPNCGDVYPDMLIAKIKQKQVSLPESENDNLSGLIVYPNPAQNSFTIEYSDTKLGGDLSIKVLNILGSIIYSETINNFNGKLLKKLDLNLAEGVYLIEISNSELREVRKVVIE